MYAKNRLYEDNRQNFKFFIANVHQIGDRINLEYNVLKSPLLFPNYNFVTIIAELYY